MVKNIIYIVILAVIGIPSWQIGTVMLEKKEGRLYPAGAGQLN